LAKYYLVAIWPILTISFWIANFYYPTPYLENTFYSFLVLTAIHVLLKIVLEKRFTKKIKDKRTRYSFKKIISILYVGAFVAAMALIWSEGTQEVTVAFGLATAGIAFALQDLLKNLAGGAIIYMTRLYSVGDRIEINSKTGDVIDIGILYTTLLETREWITADLPTGRLTTIPNGSVLSTNINNYTRDHNYIWDEIAFPLDYRSDSKYAQDRFMKIVTEETKETVARAAKSIEKMGEKYYLGDNSTEPIINIALTGSEISVRIRYTVDTRQRGRMKHKISSLILEEIKKSDGKIQVATSTLDIVGFPKSNTKGQGIGKDFGDTDASVGGFDK